MTFGEGQRESLDGAWGEGGDTQVKGALLSENNLEKQVWQTRNNALSSIITIWNAVCPSPRVFGILRSYFLSYQCLGNLQQEQEQRGFL